ncbi:hypothetical protein BC828DRAFT_394196 [Blastocladiella britannica]|nr:hypothetical protein BC828DRAFT_394196 [Blastocladiella britannica]
MLSRDSPRRGSPTGAATHKSGENSNTNSPASTTALPGRSLSTPMSVTTAALDSVTASLAGTRIHGGGDREAMPPTPAVPTRAPTDPAPYGRRGSLPGGGSMQPEPTSAAPLSPASAMSALPLLYGRSAQGRDDGEEGDDEESGSYADTRDDDDASDTEGGALTAGDIPSEIPLSQAHSPVFGSASAPISSFSGSPHRSHRRSFWVGNVSDRATRDDLIAHFGSFPGFIVPFTIFFYFVVLLGGPMD